MTKRDRLFLFSLFALFYSMETVDSEDPWWFVIIVLFYFIAVFYLAVKEDKKDE